MIKFTLFTLCALATGAYASCLCHIVLVADIYALAAADFEVVEVTLF